MRFPTLLLVALIAIAGPSRPGLAAGDTAAAASFVESLGTEVTTLLGSEDIPWEERNSRLQALLRDGFDLEGVARFVLGAHWDKASADQRREYQVLFARYVLARFAQVLERQRNGRFAVIGPVDKDGADSLVQTRFGGAADEPLMLRWRVRQVDGRYRAVDVIASEVSLATTYRSEFGSVVASRGMDALLQALRARI